VNGDLLPLLRGMFGEIIGALPRRVLSPYIVFKGSALIGAKDYCFHFFAPFSPIPCPILAA
jgi:hypothetical protein